MLITNKHLQDAMQAYTQRAGRSGDEFRSTERAARAADAGVSRRDAVELSATAMEVRAAIAALRSSPEIRQDLVTSLKRQIAEGSYQVDLEEIASQLSMVL